MTTSHDFAPSVTACRVCDDPLCECLTHTPCVVCRKPFGVLDEFVPHRGTVAHFRCALEDDTDDEPEGDE